jgi:hypothetical protein
MMWGATFDFDDVMNDKDNFAHLDWQIDSPVDVPLAHLLDLMAAQLKRAFR